MPAGAQRSQHVRGRHELCGSVLSGVAVVVLLLVAPSAQRGSSFDLEEATIADLQHRMESGQDTSRSLTEKYLARIEAIDRRGPMLRSVLEINPDALTIADQLDAERKNRGARGPLHGIPILIKDNIATADRMMTTAGSLALVGAKPPTDAFIVRQLREAGDVGRLLQTLSVFVVTTVFVFLAAAAMAGIVAPRAWNSAAHRGANINGFERCFRQQIENWAARFGDCLLRGAVAVIEHFLPILIRGFRIVFANNRLQSRVTSA